MAEEQSESWVLRYPDEFGAQVILLKESGLGERKLVEEALLNQLHQKKRKTMHGLNPMMW